MEPPAPPQSGEASGSQTSATATESSGTGTGGAQPKKRELPYTITPTKIKDVDDLSIGLYTLEKPSGASGQDACLYILPKADTFSLRILREVYHPNILHFQSVVDSPTSSSTLRILVEGYSHGLLTEVNSDAARLTAKKLEKIRDLVRQLIEAVDELRTNGFYHGNLNLNNTYYDKGSQLLKLGNFREKEGKELAMSQSEDWDACGTMIKDIADILKNINPGLDLPPMDDLSHFLKNHGLPIEQVKDSALDQVYFWDKRRRTSFFVHGVVKALKIDAFRQRVQALNFIPIEWNLDDHGGILTAMDKNRVKEGKPKYTAGRVSYVRFVSGAYTHEAELKDDKKIKPDVAIDNIIPSRLCLELVRIARELGLHIC